jgi:hypothetical protein
MGIASGKVVRQGSHRRQPAVVGRRKRSGMATFREDGRAPVAGEGVDEVLQLEEGTGEVRRGPKAVDEGGMGELTEGERNGSAATRRWRGSGGQVGQRRHEAVERGQGGDGVLGIRSNSWVRG